jgi:hypothetical protein
MEQNKENTTNIYSRTSCFRVRGSLIGGNKARTLRAPVVKGEHIRKYEDKSENKVPYFIATK